MSDAKGRKTRSTKRLGVASYSGRQGRAHCCCRFRGREFLAIDCGAAEIVLRRGHEVFTQGQCYDDRNTRAQSIPISGDPTLTDVSAYLDHVMPGKHERRKYETVVLAVNNNSNQAHSCTVLSRRWRIYVARSKWIREQCFYRGAGTWTLWMLGHMDASSSPVAMRDHLPLRTRIVP